MRMEKRKFRIGHLAKQLEVEQFVIRFWEKEFDLRPTRSTGKQRFYDEDDIAIFKAIKQLLYEHGFTINGAKKQLQAMKRQRTARVIASKKTIIDSDSASSGPSYQPMNEEGVERSSDRSDDILYLQKQLQRLRLLL